MDRDYTDAAAEAGAGLSWTWPSADTMLPPVTIDHVLVDDALAVGSFTVEPVEGSDHRAVIAEFSGP